jgi:signal peptidase II
MVAGIVLVVDQLTKWWALENLQDQVIDVVWTLRFRLTLNFGAAFSVSQGRGAVISVLAILVVLVLLRSGRHASRSSAALALGLVLGGALGNLADRAFRTGDGFLGGGVVDFIDLQWWPVFNVADMGVVCGAFLLLLVSWRDEPEHEDSGSSESAPSEPGAV